MEIIIKTMQMFPHPYLSNITNRFLQTESANFCATPNESQKTADTKVYQRFCILAISFLPQPMF